MLPKADYRDKLLISTRPTPGCKADGVLSLCLMHAVAAAQTYRTLAPAVVSLSSPLHSTPLYSAPLRTPFHSFILQSLISQKFHITEQMRPRVSLPTDLFYGGQILDNKMDKLIRNGQLATVRGKGAPCAGVRVRVGMRVVMVKGEGAPRVGLQLRGCGLGCRQGLAFPLVHVAWRIGPGCSLAGVNGRRVGSWPSTVMSHVGRCRCAVRHSAEQARLHDNHLCGSNVTVIAASAPVCRRDCALRQERRHPSGTIVSRLYVRAATELV